MSQAEGGTAGTAEKRPRSPSPSDTASKKARLETEQSASTSSTAEVPVIVDSTRFEEEASTNLKFSSNFPAAGSSDRKPKAEREDCKAKGDWRDQRGKQGKRGKKEYKGRDRRHLPNALDSREEGLSNTREGGDEGEGGGEGEKKYPKKRAAVLIGYCGAGYSGMQIQSDVRTIEGDIFAALIKAGAVSADNADDHHKVDLQRSARTDSGVHAAGNCISLKMILEPPLPAEHPTLASYVNSFLPDQIRMWGFVRTIKSFQARTACDSRVYEYLLPSYCLLPPASSDPLAKQLDESSPGWRDALGTAAEFADAGIPAEEEEPERKEGKTGLGEPDNADVSMEDSPVEKTGENDGTPRGERELGPKARGEYERRRGWRLDSTTLERFRALIAQFKGTHNFHNYTVGKPFNDRSVKRYMIRLDVRDPQVVGEIEWVSVQIHGQSFMLHQIRKMMSLAMLACRTNTPTSLIPETFGPKRIHIPKAPPLGLLLEQPQFKTYNERIASKSGGITDDRDPVNFAQYKDEMEEFKLKYIYERLRQDELDTHVFHKWIRQVDCSTSKQLAFLNSKGVIPPEAQLALNNKRAKNAARGEGESGGDGGVKGEGEEQAKENEADGLDSDEDEDVNEEQLRRGELEG